MPIVKKFDFEKTGALAVSLQGQQIGVINRLTGDQNIFAFTQEYVDARDRPTLSLSFKKPTGGLITAIHAVRTRVPPFFSNLLPEGHLRDYLARRAGVKAEREFFLLAALGADLPGAVVVTPLEGETPVKIDQGPGDDNSEMENQRPALRFSLAGIQLKFSAVMEKNGGLTIPVDGRGGSWIVKLPSASHAFVTENEYVMLELARAVGMSVPKTRLVPVNEIQRLPENTGQLAGRALVIERFDRTPGGQRIHMEDFAQVFSLFPNEKYEKKSYANIAFVLWTETDEANAYEFVRRLAFSVLIGNADMHLKNWSLLYPDGRVPVLSPAYDFVSTVPYIPGDDLALSFGGSKKLNEITADQIRRFADTARMPVNPVRNLILDTVEKTAAAWKTSSHKDLLPLAMKGAIDQQIQTVAAHINR